MNLARRLTQQAKARPDAPALIEYVGGGRRVYTFARLEERTAQAASRFRQVGVGRGDVVLVAQPLSAALYEALVGLMRVGAVAMVPPRPASRERLRACCRTLPPDALLGPPKAHLLRVLVPALRRVDSAFVTGRWPVPGAHRWQYGTASAPSGIAACDADSPALLTFTSGSTGAPKAAMRTHGLLNAQYRSLKKALALQPGQKDLTTLPIFGLANLAAGVTSVLPDADLRRPAAIEPASVLRQIRAEEPTCIGAAPAFLERLLTADASALASVHRIDTGGAPVFPELLRRLRRAAPEAEVVAVYGSTEAEPIAHIACGEMQASDWEAMRSGSGLLAGCPVPETDLRILPDHWGTPIGPFTEEAFEQKALSAGKLGEIVVSGAHVLPGYLNGRGDAESKFTVGGRRWHRTGDAGYLDGEGRLWLAGRCGAKIEDERGRLYPFQAACAAQSIEGVRRVAVVAQDGQRVLVVEPAREGDPPPAAMLKEALAWAHLDAVHFVERLPVDARHNAKIDYPALRKMLEDE